MISKHIQFITACMTINLTLSFTRSKFYAFLLLYQLAFVKVTFSPEKPPRPKKIQLKIE